MTDSLQKVFEDLIKKINKYPTKEVAWRGGYLDGFNGGTNLMNNLLSRVQEDIKRLQEELEDIKRLQEELNGLEKARKHAYECGYDDGFSEGNQNR